MYRQPRQRPQQAANTPPRDQRDGNDQTRTPKKSMDEKEQLMLAEDLEAINASFINQIGANPSDKDVENALRYIAQDNRAWLKELHAKSLTHHEPLHIIVDALFLGDLEPELASLFIANESRLREVDAFLTIGDHTGNLPDSSYRRDKETYLLALSQDVVTHFEGPRHNAPVKKAIVKGIANRIKARSVQEDKPVWGPVHIAVNAVLDRNEWNWDKYRDHVEQNARPKRETRPSAKHTDTDDSGKITRPSEKAKTTAKAAERPSRKTHTPEPAVRPSAKAKADGGKASAKSSPTRASRRNRGKSTTKPQLDGEAKALVAQLRTANHGNQAIAGSIADAVEAGEYTATEAREKAESAGIALED